MGKVVPGLDVSFQVSQGPCPSGAGMRSLPAECDLRPAKGAKITPGGSDMLIVTYTLTDAQSVVTDDVVIDYGAAWHHRTVHNHTRVCVNLAPDTNPTCT